MTNELITQNKIMRNIKTGIYASCHQTAKHESVFDEIIVIIREIIRRIHRSRLRRRLRAEAESASPDSQPLFSISSPLAARRHLVRRDACDIDFRKMSRALAGLAQRAIEYKRHGRPALA